MKITYIFITSFLLLFVFPSTFAQGEEEEDFDDLLLSAEIFDQDFLHQELTTDIVHKPKPGTPEFDHPEITADSKPCVMGRQANERNLNQAAAWGSPQPTMERL
jgi:hypothetical protein